MVSRVIVSGRLKQRSYETREGEKRTVVELEVDEIGPSLKYATAKVNKANRGGGGGGGNFGGSSGGSGGGTSERCTFGVETILGAVRLRLRAPSVVRAATNRPF